MEMLLVLVVIAIPLGLIVLLIWLTLKVKQLTSEVVSIRLVLKELQQKIGFQGRQDSSVDSPQQHKPTIIEEKTMEAEKAAPSQPAIPEKSADRQTAKANPYSPFQPSPSSEKKPSVSGKSILDFLTNMNVLIWIGGAALALGGLFVVKYSIEHGLLGPWGRVIFGLSIGLLMLGAGEWFRRQPEQAQKLTSWQYLPLVVSSAGFATLYGAIFSGFALYELFPALIAILLMAMTAASGLVYSLLLGPMLALLALIGAYAVPALVSTDTPSTELLYLYLAAVLVGSFVLLRYRPWIWIGSLNLGFGLLWFLMWNFEISQNNADIFVVSLYLTLFLGLYIFQFGGRVDRPVKATSLTIFAGLMDAAGWQIYGAMAFATTSGLLMAVSLEFEIVSYLLLLGLLPTAIWLSFRDHLFEGTVWITHLGALTLIFLWPAMPNGGIEGDINVPLISVGILISFLYIGFAAWRIQIRDRMFLGVLNALASPLLIFCLLYWKYHGVGIAPEWSLIALVLAGGYAGAASFIAKSYPPKDGDPLVGLFAVGATSGLSLALAAGLEAEWLTIAFALQTVAIAWINKKIPVGLFRPLAALLAIIVIVRLELDSEVVRMLLGVNHSMDWYLYGYGVAILSFGMAWFWFKSQKSDYLVYLLESGLVLFWVTLISLAIRDGATEFLNAGSLFTLNFAENSIHTFSLLLNALGLYWLCTKKSNPVREWSWRILGFLGLFSLVFGQIYFLNPLLSYSGAVGDWLVLNWLSFGFVVPAVILVGAYKIARTEHRNLSMFALILAGFLGFLYVNAEIRHYFSPEDLVLGNYQDTEFYAYSAGWLLYASAVMLAGIWRGSRMLRQAGLLLLLLTVFKVFIFDLETLDGLLRAASFLGLGVCLIGLAFLFQRFGKEERDGGGAEKLP